MSNLHERSCARPRGRRIATALGVLTILGVQAAAAAPSVDPLLTRLMQTSRPGLEPHSGPTALPELPPLPAGIEEADGQTWLDVLVRGAVDPAAVSALGGEVRTVAGEVMTARVPLGALPGLVALPGLTGLDLASGLEPQSDVSLAAIGAREAWGGPPPGFSPTGRTGRGVVVGIVDTGIDPTHADFRTSSGTRILWLWDQNFGLGGSPPAGYSYGSEYSSAALNAGQYTQGDVDGHGTHITGVAAGNGRGTGGSVPQYTYMGAAPEADLIVVRLTKNGMGTYDDSKLIDGVNYVFSKAAAARKPAVVVLAMGKQTGPRDGNDPLDVGLSNLTGPGKLLVCAAGNYGVSGRHGEVVTSGSGQTRDITVSVGPYNPGATGAEHFYAEAWYGPGVNYSISVVTPLGYTVGPVARGTETTVQSPSGIVQISNGTYVGADGSYRVNFYIYRGNSTLPVVSSGTWTYRAVSQTGGSQRLDLWITDYAMGASIPTVVQGRTDTRLVSSPATGDAVVSVAAYSTKRSWTDITGIGRFYPSAVLEDIADFSSPGPRRDGSQAPHIAAPGYGVVGARSAQTYPSNMWLMPDNGQHRMNQGTSVAAAHVAGAVALMLQDDGDLTPAQVLERLTRAAATDSRTGTVPNHKWGAGKLRVPAANATGVDGRLLARFAFGPAYPNPSRAGCAFEFSVPAEDVAGGPVPVRVRVLDVRGREVASLAGRSEAGPQRLRWDGRLASGAPAPAGVYWSQLEIGGQRAARKFVRLD